MRWLVFGKRWRKKRKWRRVEWMSHGFDAVDGDESSVVVQREQIQKLDLWLFGISDAQIGDRLTNYIHSHLFYPQHHLHQWEIIRKSKETMRKAYLGVRAEVREEHKEKRNETWSLGSVSVLVINGERLVIANMGHYRAVLSTDGVAHQIKSTPTKPCFLRLFPPCLFPRTSALVTNLKGSQLAVGVKKIEANTEFVILASTGIWDVMKNQEAVNLIWHIQDPQEAAQCLAKEASTRMTKTNISCIVIRLN